MINPIELCAQPAYPNGGTDRTAVGHGATWEPWEHLSTNIFFPKFAPQEMGSDQMAISALKQHYFGLFVLSINIFFACSVKNGKILAHFRAFFFKFPPKIVCFPHISPPSK